jgi:hypothetical protein
VRPHPYYPADTLSSLADAETYRPPWSAEILSELRRNLISNARLAPASVDRRMTRMRAAFPDAEVTGYGRLVSVMPNHEKDRHVRSARVLT